MSQTPTKSSNSTTAIVIAAVAIILAVSALGYAFVENPSGSVSSLSSQVSSVQAQLSSLPTVDQAPTTRNITMEWGFLISQQDRWFPQTIVVNEGDTLALVLNDNDTDGAHTFTINAPTGANGKLQITQVNMTMPGQWEYTPPQQSGPQFGTETHGAPVNCITEGQPSPCNTSGGCSINGAPLGMCTGSWMLTSSQSEIAAIQAHVTIGPFTAPGVYKFYCVYHQAIGMFGYLIVLPNSGYTA
jgi:hypothetical protein